MWDSPAVEQYDEGISKDSRRVDIYGLEEACCAALVQSARYLEGIRCYHDRNFKERSFNVGDLVLCRIQNTEGLHKRKRRWGLGCGYLQLALSLCPNRLRHPAQRGRKMASPASKRISSSIHNIET
jgi:hypothetical protein